MTEWPNAGVTILPAGADVPPPSRPGWLRPLAVAVVVALIASAAVFLGRGSLLSGGHVAVGALDLVHASAAKTSAAGTSKFEISMNMQDGSHNQTAHGSGAFDYPHRAGTVTMTVPEIGNMTVLFVNNVIYMQMPTSALSMLGNVGAKAHWIKVDLSKLPSDDSGDPLSDQMFGDPSQFLQALVSTTDAKKVGTESVRGVPTTHYSTDVSLAQLVKAWSIGATHAHQGVGAGTAHIEVWLDKQGLTRRLRTSFSMAKLGTASMTIEYFDFGAPVHVTPPPPSDVIDFAHLLTTFSSSVTVRPPTTGTAPSSLATSRVDADVKSDLRELAIDEETYFTDHASYATAAQLGCACTSSLHHGDTFVLHLNRLNSYCIAGHSSTAPSRWWVYASDRGGVAESVASHDACSSARYPTEGGHVHA